MQPNPIAETSRLLFPSFRFFILKSPFGVTIKLAPYHATFWLSHALLPDLLRYCFKLPGRLAECSCPFQRIMRSGCKWRTGTL
jgi:hypothetical protein